VRLSRGAGVAAAASPADAGPLQAEIQHFGGWRAGRESRTRPERSARRRCPDNPQPARRAAPTPAALPPALLNAVATLAAAAPGDVDAPVGAVVVGALVVTAASLLLVQGLKPGTDAAEKIFDRDSKTGRRR